MSFHFGAGWTDERVTELKSLWADGFSCSQIAAKMGGITRNAVIGKVHRLGLVGRPRDPNAPAKPRKKQVRHNFTRTLAIINGSDPGYIEAKPCVDIEIPISQRRTLMELTHETCRWPVGDPANPDFYFCGAKPHGDRSYCAEHCRIAYVPKPKRISPSIEDKAKNELARRAYFRRSMGEAA
jgi:GcrA cell cycle regulator